MKSHLSNTVLRCVAATLCALGTLTVTDAAEEPTMESVILEFSRYEPGASLEPLRQLGDWARDSARHTQLRKQLDAALSDLIAGEATYEAKRLTCQLLAVVGGDQSVAALGQLLGNEQTVGIACLALATHSSPKADEVIRMALTTATGRSRLQMVATLADRRDPASLPVLARLANDPDLAIADSAIVGLGKLGTDGAIKELETMRKQPRPGTELAVVEASLLVAERLALASKMPAARAIYEDALKTSQPLHVRRAALDALIRLDRSAAEKRILGVLQGNDPTLKPVAIAAVRSLSSSSASKRFAAELPKLSTDEKVWMLQALAGRGDAAALDALAANLTATEPAVRLTAIKSVGRLGDASSVPVLVKAIGPSSAESEQTAMTEALIGLRGGWATDKAILGQMKAAAPESKAMLIGVLTRRGSKAAVPQILAEADSTNEAVAKAAFQAAGNMSTPADLPALLDRVMSLQAPGTRPDAEGALSQVMARIPEAGRRSELVREQLARTTDVEAKCSLLRTLPSAGDPAALDALKAASKDPNAQVRDAAIRSLAQWPDSTAWDALIAVLQQPEKETHRVLALRGLVRLAGDENARVNATLVDRYRQLLGAARTDDDRKLILSALSGANHPDALQLAVAQLSNAGVRAEAQLAVKKIAAAIKAQHPQAAQQALDQVK